MVPTPGWSGDSRPLSPRERSIAVVVVVAATAAISVPLVWESLASTLLGAGVVVAGVLLLALGALISRRPEAVGVAVAAVVVALWAAFLGVGTWPLPLLAAVLVATVVVRRTDKEAATAWLRRGHVDRTVWALSVLTVAVTALALFLWSVWADPDGGPYLESLRDRPVVLALAGILAFSLVNSLCEETVYRGLLQHALTLHLGVVAAVAVQALAFGVLHSSGFPSGASGIALATIYGALLGVLRHRSGGLLAPYVVHVLADVTIGLIVVTTL